MRIKCFVLPALFLALFLCVAQGQEDDNAKRWSEIEGLINDGLYDQAIERIEAFLAERPTGGIPELLRFQLGELQMRTDRFADAVKTFDAFLREHPESPRINQARFLLGSALRITGDLARAQNALADLLRQRGLTDELRIAALEKQGEILTTLGKNEDAVRVLEDLVGRQATAERRLSLADVYYDLARFKDAERQYREVIDSAELTADERKRVTLRLALVLYQRKGYRDVEELLSPLLDAYGGDDAIRMTLVWSLYQLKRFEEAYQVLGGRPTSEADRLAAAIREGRSLIMVHEYEAAIQFFERMIEAETPSPRLKPAFTTLSESYFALGDAVGGLGVLERLAAVLDDDADRYALWRRIGDEYMSRLGDQASAIAAYRKSLAANAPIGAAEEITLDIIRAQTALGDMVGAGDTVASFLESFSQSSHTDEVLFLAGGIYERSGDDDRALEQYRRIAQSQRTGEFRGKAYEAAFSLVYRLRRWDTATAIGEEYLRDFPAAADDADLLMKLARALYRQGDYRKGIRHLENALVAGQGNFKVSDVLLQMGWGYYKLGELDKAAAQYSQITEHYQNDAGLEEALYWLGQLNQVKSDLASANHFFQSLLERFPDSRFAEISLWQMASNHLRRDEATSAIAALRAIVDRFPDGLYADLARAKLVESYVNVGNYRSALENIPLFVNADPAQRLSPAELLSRGNKLAETGNRRAALEAFRTLLERFPASEAAAEATLNIGILHYQMGNYTQAAGELRKVAEVFPDSEKAPQAAYYLGQTLMRLNRWSEAVVQFNACIEKRGERRGVEIIYYLIGACNEQLGDTEGAVSAYRDYLSHLQQPETEFRRRLDIAALFSRGGYLDEAVSQLESIISAAQDPEVIIEAQFGLAAVYERKGQLEQAAVEYLKVTYVHSSSPMAALTARFQAGKIFEQLGRLQDAINVYRKIAENHAGTRFGEVAGLRIEALRKQLAGSAADDGTSIDPQP